MSKWLSFGATSLLVFVVDRLTKLWVLKEVAVKGPIKVNSFFNIVYVTNKGGAFGIGRHGDGNLFLVASILAIIVVLSLMRRLHEPKWYVSASLGAVLGGGLGNILDRLLYGEVIDFIDLHLGNMHWPAFNIADSAIVVGVLLFAVLYKGKN